MRKYTDQELRLLQLLSKRYPTITAAHIEMINLHAILALPKGTDHYISDIHGAYEQFDHILRHASGAIRRKVNQTFGGELSDRRQVDLAMLIYYPEQKLRQMLAALDDPREWMAATIGQLARVARTASEKYTRSKVRKRLAPQLAYILEELLTESSAENSQKEYYYRSIIDSILDLGEGAQVIVTLAYLIQRLAVDRLYILGDIYDRGPAAERVIDRLIAYHDVTIQWGNHDISWMAAASGCDALIANVIRMALRYASLETLLDGYDISLRSLARFAEVAYRDDPCAVFQPKPGPPVEDYTRELIAKMHKAIAIIQFKLEAQIIARHPEYAMQDRVILDRIDLADGTVTLGGTSYPLRDTRWPTLDPADPAALTEGEAQVVAELREEFQHSDRLREHIRFLYSYGSMFQVRDGNLLFHGCLPVDPQGEFIAFPLGGELLSGPALLERYEQMAREAFFGSDTGARQAGQDAMWYLWCGQHSPLFGRTRMTTFERYFIADPATHAEPKGPYYRLRESEAFCIKVLAAFGGDVERGHIINGHTPVKVRTGERPLMANGRLIVIDGGMSEAYQPVTGIAGYTLIANSHELLLSVHEVFTSAEELIRQGSDITPQTERIATFEPRALIAATDTGKLLRGQLEDLRKLVDAYREGELVEGAAQ
ncbi:MAG TPA: fructose-1,6-bisphosphatase [Roseiflexaceae bacterium]|nr:fructose-1,6-bisphosphatase [Roseiflexaceae bacterium]